MSFEVTGLLAAAAKRIASVRNSWLLTTGETGAVNARPMGRIARDLDQDDWSLRFITDGRSRKASDIRRTGKATIIFQQADDAFVTVVGASLLCEDPSQIRNRWKSAYDAYFATEEDRANAAFIEITVQQMDLWIRGITPEPFGLRPTKLERNAAGAWVRASQESI